MSEDRYAHGLLKWEERFKALGEGAWAFGAGPAPEVAQAARLYRQRAGESGGVAVDLGAGDGRNAIFLAEQGFEVLAVEAAPTGARRIADRLAERGLKGWVETVDLRTYVLPAGIDLLVACHVVHLLPEPYRRIREWQSATRPGGICLVSSRGPIPEDPPGYYWYPERGELKHCFAFAGWKVLATYEEESLHDEATLVYRTGVIAQKPGE
jgi:SAM-dependent methyltransferase